ncbi:S-adenosyl-L-methionine-dependent methyltransferase superfamily protein [Abeliophyllum distichum]|uniref:S-adenosyl-L-methionine-dependent methyltransferase superfamily protein n=1 Tax=Abeliophyllum distichum TaxID=126358 RepID=A0ABD1SY33_9LAMI
MALNLLSLSARPSPTTSAVMCQAIATTFSVLSVTPPLPLQPPLLSLPQKSIPMPLPSSSCALHCPHFQSCSGCTHEYNLHNPAILDEANDFFEKLGVSEFNFDTCRLWGWRCRAKLAVRGPSTKPLIGLYREGTHDVVDIPECKAHHPSINAAVELLKQGMSKLNIEPYDEDQGAGELRYVQMAVTTYNTSLPASQRYKNGKVQVALVWNSRNENSPSSEKLNDLANFIWRNGGAKGKVHLIHSIWANFQTSTNNIIFGNRWRHLLGERDFWEHVGGIDVSLAPSSFGQANTRAFDFLLRKLHKYVPSGASVVDLYAGAGVIGLSLATMRKCRSVKCVEVNKESKVSFEKTAARLPATLDSSISWHHADASKEPLSWLVGSDVVVVDPPRKGLDLSLLDTLRSLSSLELKSNLPESTSAKAKNEKRPWVLRERETSVQVKSSTVQEESRSLPETLIYISCGWDSFKEDCMSLLSSKAWYLDKAHGFNFFPGTQSIEILAVFKRVSKPNIKRRKSGKKKRPS